MNNVSPWVVIEPTVKLGSNVSIAPFVVLRGNTVVGDNVMLGSFCNVANSTIGSGTMIDSSNLDGAVVGCNCQIGPFAHLRKGSVIEDDCKVGNFVETKNATLGRGTKASHLSYLGDATLGECCNVGCGVITANYDGASKHHTQIGDNVFLGCNSNIIAPAKLGDNVFVACATENGVRVERIVLSPGRRAKQEAREYVRARASQHALFMALCAAREL